MRNTRIFCTIGPASGSMSLLEQMVKAGMDVARLNMSYGTLDEHSRYIRSIRSVAGRAKNPVAILLDLQGIKIRIGEVAGGNIRLEKGREIRLRAGQRTSDPGTLYIIYQSLLRDVKEGHRVLLDDGLLELMVTGRKGSALLAVVREGGVLTSRKGVNLPDSGVSARYFTKKDHRDLEFGVREGVDAVALSYVTKPEDVSLARKKLRQLGSEIPIIAKIEKPAAVDRIDSILDVSDGIMVARGDLGVEGVLPAVPMIQKDLIRRANRKGRIVITATQMLESMRVSSVPTRAETADVANAVLDGSDAVMLSGETSVGRYPVQAVRTMARIIEVTETGDPSFRDRMFVPERMRDDDRDKASFAVADAAVRAASDLDARCIVAFTRSGYTAGLLAKFRPCCPIIAFTSKQDVVNRMKLYWGVLPRVMQYIDNTDSMVSQVEDALLRGKLAKVGDVVVITASLPMSGEGRTNFMKVHRIEK
jgi:pyruvate kinase